MQILIVEDSKQDRELMKYLLESRFQNTATFFEADSLRAALDRLSQESIDCIILDLQLPDSTGKETFERVSQKFPEVPVVVMTHNKDRELALEMIQKGAQEFVIKNYTDEEELFRRVLFAIEKHKRTVRVPTEEAASIHRLEQARARMLTAHEGGEHQLMQSTTFEATHAIADLSRRMFSEIQKLHTNSTKQGVLLEHTCQVTDKLKVEILEGYPNRPSMRSQVEHLNSRVDHIENQLDKDRSDQRDIQKAVMSSRTQVVVALLGLFGVIGGATVGAYFAYKASLDKASTVQTEKKE
jgi:CheY-like chemotaxis protein